MWILLNITFSSQSYQYSHKIISARKSMPEYTLSLVNQCVFYRYRASPFNHVRPLKQTAISYIFVFFPSIQSSHVTRMDALIPDINFSANPKNYLSFTKFCFNYENVCQIEIYLLHISSYLIILPAAAYFM